MCSVSESYPFFRPVISVWGLFLTGKYTISMSFTRIVSCAEVLEIAFADKNAKSQVFIRKRVNEEHPQWV